MMHLVEGGRKRLMEGRTYYSLAIPLAALGIAVRGRELVTDEPNQCHARGTVKCMDWAGRMVNRLQTDLLEFLGATCFYAKSNNHFKIK